MFGKEKRRLNSEVNAGSMADIAFLLLIFFLVTTTILNEKGILVRLPPLLDEPVKPLPENKVFTVKLNANNQIFAENEITLIVDLKEKAKYHIMNPDKKDNLPPKPSLSIISLQNDRSTEYETYVWVYNELKAAFNELWEEAAQNRHGLEFAQLSKAQKDAIKNYIPQIISESEPTDFENLAGG